jgi:ABC-type proline/glycine betaine transport system ATPase subunit
MEVSVSTNDVNTFSVSELDYIRETIENMNKFNQIEVLRIMNKHSEITLNENKYGVHINLSELQNEIIEELTNYIKYVNTQEVTLHQAEKQKESFKNIYFTKDNKDKNTKNSK